jgi:hypothetical protein
LLNVCVVVAEYPIEAEGLALTGQTSGLYRYRNERCLPRAFVMARARPVSSWQEAQARLAAGHDPTESALVENAPPLDGPPGWEPATLRYRSPNRLIVRAEGARPALLVLSEVWYPGWQATVEGERRPIVRVDGILRGVYLGPGEQTVVWRYRPASLRWGAIVTLCALIAWSSIALLPAWPRIRSVDGGRR